MLDVKWIREHPDQLDENMRRRGEQPIAASVIEVDRTRRMMITKLQELVEQRKELETMVASDDESLVLLSREIKDLRQVVKYTEEQQRDLLLTIPNILADGVTDGELNATTVLALTTFASDTKRKEKRPDEAHYLNSRFDGEWGARISGSRFTVLRGDYARLERALGNFMIDTVRKAGQFEEVSVPTIVKTDALVGTGQLPKFAGDLFQIGDTDLWMSPTSEVQLTNFALGQSFNVDDLPFRFTALTPCYRAEAGAAGADTKGLIRQHQFNKVEMVTLCDEKNEDDEFFRMVMTARSVLEQLGLPYRTVDLPSREVGFSAMRTVDIDVWFPAQNTWREVSSISMCGDFQSRRMSARYRAYDGEKWEWKYVRTLNGSGLAVGRVLAALIETHGDGDTVAIPGVLQPYFGGEEAVLYEKE